MVGTTAAAAAERPPTGEPPATPAPQASPTPEPSPKGTPAPPTTASTERDIFDVLRALLHKPPPKLQYDYRNVMLAVAPVISYNPANGAGFGVAGNVAFYRGPPASTQISSLVASATATTKGQVLVNAKLDVSSRGNDWNMTGDNRLYWTSQSTYGLGSDTSSNQAVGMDFDYFRVFETVYREVRPHVYLGAGFRFGEHTNVGPDENAAPIWENSPYVEYSNQSDFPLESQTSAGASLHLLFDSRDSPINPSRGRYANLNYEMFFQGFLGGTSSWQLLEYDARIYVRLSADGRHKLAFWNFGSFVTGGTAPYLDLPATGWDTYGRSGRGYGQGRFRGEQMLYGEVEYRWTIKKNGLFGMVAFLNTETLSNRQAGEKLFDSFASAAGVGLRVLINKHSKTNLAIDFARGEQGEHGVYLAVQEAF
jgi:hypothetical protein